MSPNDWWWRYGPFILLAAGVSLMLLGFAIMGMGR